jgi:hypothetical protein
VKRQVRPTIPDGRDDWIDHVRAHGVDAARQARFARERSFWSEQAANCGAEAARLERGILSETGDERRQRQERAARLRQAEEQARSRAERAARELERLEGMVEPAHRKVPASRLDQSARFEVDQSIGSPSALYRGELVELEPAGEPGPILPQRSGSSAAGKHEACDDSIPSRAAHGRTAGRRIGGEGGSHES